MSIKQFLNTLKRIKHSPNVNFYHGMGKHILWHVRKIFKLFPYDTIFSNSFIRIQRPHQGVAALVNCIGIYDYNNMSLIKQLSLENFVFFDIGANIGTFTLLMAESRNSVIHSFEPHPHTYRELCFNVRFNNYSNVFLNNVALSNETKIQRFTNFKNGALNRMVRDEKCFDYVITKSITCQEYCKKVNVIPDCVKIDVEGSECDVLLGFGSILKQIKLIIIEINSITSETQVKSLLALNMLNGPFYYDHVKRAFTRSRNNEDPIFLSNGFISSDYFIKGFTLQMP